MIRLHLCADALHKKGSELNTFFAEPRARVLHLSNVCKPPVASAVVSSNAVVLDQSNVFKSALASAVVSSKAVVLDQSNVFK